MTSPDSLSKSFGLSIAFLIPGAVGLYAISFFSPTIRAWFTVNPDGPTVGGFLFAVLGSAGMGVFISGLRRFVLESDHGVKKFGWTYAPSPPEGLDMARRKDESCEAAYQDLLFRHYQFYQFYANMPFALAFAYMGWVVTSPDAAVERAVWLALLMFVADALLLVSGRHAIHRYEKKVKDLLGLRDIAA